MNIPFSIIFITIFNKPKFHIDKLKRNLRLKIENVSRIAMWKIKKRINYLKDIGKELFLILIYSLTKINFKHDVQCLKHVVKKILKKHRKSFYNSIPSTQET